MWRDDNIFPDVIRKCKILMQNTNPQIPENSQMPSRRKTKKSTPKLTVTETERQGEPTKNQTKAERGPGLPAVWGQWTLHSSHREQRHRSGVLCATGKRLPPGTVSDNQRADPPRTTAVRATFQTNSHWETFQAAEKAKGVTQTKENGSGWETYGTELRAKKAVNHPNPIEMLTHETHGKKLLSLGWFRVLEMINSIKISEFSKSLYRIQFLWALDPSWTFDPNPWGRAFGPRSRTQTLADTWWILTCWSPLRCWAEEWWRE